MKVKFINVTGKGVPAGLEDVIETFQKSAEQSVVLSEQIEPVIIYRERENSEGSRISYIDFTGYIAGRNIFRTWLFMKVDWNRKQTIIFCQNTADMKDLMDAARIVGQELFEKGITGDIKPLSFYENTILGGHRALLNKSYERCEIDGSIYEPLLTV